MQTKYFVAATFSQENVLFYQRLKSFREKFDFKNGKNLPPLITLIPPFTANRFQDKELLHNIEDDFDTFLAGSDLHESFKFEGVHAFQGSKKKTLYLKAHLPNEYDLVREVVSDYFSPQELNRMYKSKHFIYHVVLGRFYHDSLFNEAFKLSFKSFSGTQYLQPSQICLFAKVRNTWVLDRVLYEFSPYEARRKMVSQF